MHVPDELVHGEPAYGEEREADERVERLAGREVEHREEDAEEEERRPQVLLEDDDDHRHRPHREDRQQVGHRRDRERPDAPGMRDDLAELLEVRGEEHDEKDLHGLPRLEVEPRDADPDARAVDLAADDRQQRRDQQDETEDRPGPLEARERGEIARDEDRRRERAGGDDHPCQLLEQQWLIRGLQPLHEDQAERRQSRGEREEQLVAAHAAPCEEQMQREHERDECDGNEDLPPVERRRICDGACDRERRDPDDETDLASAAQEERHDATAECAGLAGDAGAAVARPAAAGPAAGSGIVSSSRALLTSTSGGRMYAGFSSARALSSETIAAPASPASRVETLIAPTASPLGRWRSRRRNARARASRSARRSPVCRSCCQDLRSTTRRRAARASHGAPTPPRRGS